MKIGIITLHKVPNYGSALQAYALQCYLKRSTGADVELIDYRYPNKYHGNDINFFYKIKRNLRRLYYFILRKNYKRNILFKSFYANYFNLSSNCYKSIEEINNTPPVYDIYVTGSDQVWNINTLKADPVMFCDFAPAKSLRISFGASFAIKSLPIDYYSKYRKLLAQYSYIGVREHSSLNILEELELPNNINILLTCDPTLLLNAAEYGKLANHSKIKISDDYILIYLLNYAYNPEPAISILTEKVADFLNYKVILLGVPKFSYNGKYKIILDAGPCEFLYLFKNAKFVVTSSFHGTMFSLINRVPFFSILPDSNNDDCRIKDILSVLGLERQGIPRNKQNTYINFSNPFDELFEKKFNDYINKSKNFLKQAINTDNL